MNKSILVHNDNVQAIDSFLYSIKFSPTCSDIDEYISTDILKQIKSLDFEVIFIKDNLSGNYLEFYGLILAYHIRLSQDLGDKRYVPIVILSDLDGYIINRLTKVGQILFTKSVFIGPNSKATVKKYNSENLVNLSEQDYLNRFLKIIDIDPPEDSTNHDISNKWSIYRWAQFLKISDSSAIINNELEISSIRYFKFLVAKHPIHKEIGLKFASKSPKNTGKILYIDDEWAKGWQDIFAKYFSKSENIIFDTVEESYKDKSYDDIENFVIRDVKAKNPDVIILDMRLIGQDHKENTAEKDLSGIKLLSHIKTEINPGIQIIILTASGKSAVLDEANKHHILGYIKKEHPQDRNIKTKDSFDKLTSLINTGLDRKYLKDIWDTQTSILSILRNDPFKKYFSKNEHEDSFGLLDITVHSVYIILDQQIPNYLQYSMLAIFKCLEILKDLFVKEPNRVLIIIGNDQPIKLYEADSHGVYIPKAPMDSNYYRSTENQLHALVFERFDIRDKSVHEEISRIVQKRNNYIHPGRPGQNNTLYSDDILGWFKVLSKVISKI